MEEGLPPSDNIRSLILEKEKELHDINEYRIRTLEGLLKEKENTTNEWKQSFNKLKEDFHYNLKLIEERDEELDRHEQNFANLQKVLRDRDGEISDLRIQIADIESFLQQEKAKSAEQETFYQRKLKELRDEVEGTRWSYDDEQRQQREEIETFKRTVEQKLREKDEDLDNQRREMTITFDEVMRQRETEFKQRMDSLTENLRDLELKFKSSQRELEQTRERNTELRQNVEELQHAVQESEKETKDVKWELEDVRQLKDAKIAELEEEKIDLQNIKQALLDEYEGKMSELLQSLHSVERAFMKQKEHYEDDMTRCLAAKTEEMKSNAARFETRIEALSTNLRSTEQSLERVQGEFKQAKWDYEDQLSQRQREIDTLRADLNDSAEQRDSYVNELKNQLWNKELELKSAQEKLENLTRNFDEYRDKLNHQRSSLLTATEREEELKRQLVQQNLQWESRWQEKEHELVSRNELAYRELKQAKDRLVADKQTSDERLAHTENELQRLRSELYSLRAQARVSETFGMDYTANNSAVRASPAFSDDLGPPSPVKGMGAYSFSPSPNHRVQNQKINDLEQQNERLRDVISQMRAEMERLHTINSPDDSAPSPKTPDVNRMEIQLKQQREYCALLQKQLDAASSENVKSAEHDELVMLRTYNRELTEMLEESRSKLQKAEAQVKHLEEELKNAHNGTQDNHSTEMKDGGSQNALQQAEINELKAKLDSANQDVERLMTERNKLMESSNQLRATLNKLEKNEYANPRVDEAVEKAKKQMASLYETKILEIASSLKEFKAHNKVLKRELRRIYSTEGLKHSESLESLHSQKSDFDELLIASKVAEEDTVPDESPIPSNDEHEEHDADASELITIKKKKKSNTLGKKKVISKSASAPALPKGEDELNDELGESLRKLKLLKQRRTSESMALKDSTKKSTRRSSTQPSTSLSRVKLKEAREMLELSGKRAELKPAEAVDVPIRASNRATSSQVKASSKLKTAMKRRAEMAAERKKVRNYNIAD